MGTGSCGILTGSSDEEIQYAIAFHNTLFSLEGNLRGGHLSSDIMAQTFAAIREYYDADLVALIELDYEANTGIYTMDSCAPGVKSWHGTVVDIEPQKSPYFSLHIKKGKTAFIDLTKGIPEKATSYEQSIIEALNAKIMVAAPYSKRENGFLFMCNPKRFYGKYTLLQALSYVIVAEKSDWNLRDKQLLASEAYHGQLKPNDLHVYGLGGFSIRTLNGTISSKNCGGLQVLRILAYLLVNRHHPVSADELQSAIWGDIADFENDRPYRQAIARVRKKFRKIVDGDIISTGNGYYLNRNYNIYLDTAAFEANNNNAMSLQYSPTQRIEYGLKAMDIYKGDLFPEVKDIWIDKTRASYHVSYVKLACWLCGELCGSKRFDTACNVASRALKIEPNHGDLMYWNIRSLAMLKSYDLARKHLEKSRSFLSDDQITVLENLLNNPNLT